VTVTVDGIGNVVEEVCHFLVSKHVTKLFFACMSLRCTGRSGADSFIRKSLLGQTTKV